MPRAQDPVETAARDRLHRLAVPRGPWVPGAFARPGGPWVGEPADGAVTGWVPGAPTGIDADVPAHADDGGRPAASGPPAEGDVRDVVARIRVGALDAAATAYTAAHGHPLEHPRLDPGPDRRRWYLSVRLAVVAGVAIAVLGAGVTVRATLAAPTVPVAALPTPSGSAADDATTTGPAAPGQSLVTGRLPGGGSTGPPSTSGEAALLVHVVGQVLAPGVVRLPAGSRVSDAVAAAGGAAPGADLAALNLARVVGDGEQIVVPAPGQVVGGPTGAGPSAAAGRDRLVDLNSADLAALDALPGIGPVLAQRVLDWRDQHGRFTDVAELGEVAGIGPTLLGRLRDLVRV